ncbi:MmgE/PrpD family protein [Actibacterium pelagium]|uniref:2-methylcitrate dehydratase PrpD n=1 Tax=Actibacterium pelagium TaxID=2029103 RepID=A0A917AEA7_9RHOB|nr:MmgE/PrpD family protein [Actibacterium pelagium]GGE45532.1 hypothetical protein GCM10011517_11420 [Actibacterium pelagium]
MNDPDSIDATVARYISKAGGMELPPEVEMRARCHLLDTIAAILSGRFLPAGQFGYRFVEGAKQIGPAALLGSTSRTSVEYAAFANAMAAHADETDDSHIWGRFHPGCGIVPAALAMAERQGSSGAALLRAIALGYDIGARATMALGYSNPKTTVFSTHSFGSLFGAAAASGTLAQLSAAQCEAMLSFTVQQTSGLSYWNRDPDHVQKSFDFGAKSARNGVFAALLAEAGMTAPDHPLTGENSFLAAFAEAPRPEALYEELGERFEIARSSIKKWSVGSPLQSVLDAVEAIFGGKTQRGEDIDAITVHLPSNRIHIVDNRHMPAVCAQHLVALSTLRGRVGFAASHDAALMSDPEILALRQKIRLVADDALTHARPERQSIVEIRMADGKTLRHHARVVRGTPDDPMSPDEVCEKAGDILGGILPDGGTRLISLCLEENFQPGDLVDACLIGPHPNDTIALGGT